MNKELREAFRTVMKEIGRKGGKARLKKLTPERRREIAVKASKASAKARTKRAQERRRAAQKS